MEKGLGALGIIMLDTAFPRPVGDVGHPDSWPFPVLFERVPGASVAKVVGGDDNDLIDLFVQAGHRLIERGAAALTTSCGFLAARQSVLAKRLPVPFAASSLLQINIVNTLLPEGRRAGVITFNAKALGTVHYTGVAAPPDTPTVGLPEHARLRGVIERGEPYDHERISTEVVEAALALSRAHPDLGAIVMECTNLPPFSAAVAKATGMPVFDILTLGRWLMSATCGQVITPRGF